MLAGVHGGSSAGDLLVLGGAAVYSLQILLMERYAPRYDPLGFTLVRCSAAFAGARRSRRSADARGAARLDGVGRAARDRRLRERARVPRADVGAAAHEREPHGARLHARAGLGGALRLHARGRPARRARLGRLRRDHGRDRARRAGGGRRARAARAPAAGGMTAVLLALASAAFFGAMTVAIRHRPARRRRRGAATLATLLPAVALALVAAVPRHDLACTRGRSSSPA